MEARSVYLLSGDEEFLKDEWIRKVRQAAFKDAKDSSADFSLYNSDDVDISELVSAARTQPFLSSKRLIILKSADKLAATSSKEQLLSYVKSPNPSTILILEAGIKDRSFARNAFLAEVSKHADTHFFKRIYDEDLSDWINRQFSAHKKKIAAPAVNLLKELKGNNLTYLAKEIEKLILYAKDEPVITAAHVQELVGRDITGNVSDIIDAMSRNDKKRAMALSLDFQKNDITDAIVLFCWNLRRVLKVRESLKEGWPLEQIGRELDLKKYQLDRFVAQAKKLKTSWLKRALSELAGLDLEVKTSGFGGDVSYGWNMAMVKLLALL